MEDSLELLVLKLIDQSFGVFMSMSIAILLWICGLEGKLKIKGKYVFANSLLGTIIQDDSIKERNIYHNIS